MRDAAGHAPAPHGGGEELRVQKVCLSQRGLSRTVSQGAEPVRQEKLERSHWPGNPPSRPTAHNVFVSFVQRVDSHPFRHFYLNFRCLKGKCFKIFDFV